MTPEQFNLFVDYVKRNVLEVIGEANTDPSFDITNPIFFFGNVSTEGEPQIMVFNDDDHFPGIGRWSAHMVFELFQKFCAASESREAKEKDGMHARIAAVMLSGGWQKDPNTFERKQEIITLSIEDSDRNIAVYNWNLIRNESGPCTLEPTTDFVHIDYDYEHHGALQNFFNHPARIPAEKVN